MIDEKLKDMAERYAKASSVGRQDIFRKEVSSCSLKRLREMAVSFYGDECPTDHNDRDFLTRLVSWAVVEKSGILNQETRASLERHRQALIVTGPKRELTVNEKDEDKKEKLEGGKHMKTEKRNLSKAVGDPDVKEEVKTETVSDKKSKIATLTGKKGTEKDSKKKAESEPKKTKTSTDKKADKKSSDDLVFRSKLTGPVYITDVFTMKAETVKSLPEKGPLSYAKVFSGKGKVGDFVAALRTAKSSGRIKFKSAPNQKARGLIKRMIRHKMISKAS